VSGSDVGLARSLSYKIKTTYFFKTEDQDRFFKDHQTVKSEIINPKPLALPKFLIGQLRGAQIGKKIL